MTVHQLDANYVCHKSDAGYKTIASLLDVTSREAARLRLEGGSTEFMGSRTAYYMKGPEQGTLHGLVSPSHDGHFIVVPGQFRPGKGVSILTCQCEVGSALLPCQQFVVRH